MKVAVSRETVPGERRVALVPDAVSKLVKSALDVLVERDAGRGSFFGDQDYIAAGARVIDDKAAVLSEADIVLKVQRPEPVEIESLREGAVLVSFLQPHTAPEAVRLLAARKVTALSMDLVPRITRAQDMDALSSMSTLSGYRAVLLGAVALGRMMPMIVSAAGTLTPARVLILGVGVAGLQAIATAKRLGAVVSAFDVRAATKEQVQSLGATFIEMEIGEKAEEATGYAKELSRDSQAQVLATLAKHVKGFDLVVTTALIPGRAAPLLVTADMVRSMKPGSVIIDLAAEAGGNCELTKAGEEAHCQGVTILGPTNLPSTIPCHASQMFSKNISNVLKLIVKDGALKLDFEDAVVKGMCVTHAGEVVHEAARKALGLS